MSKDQKSEVKQMFVYYELPARKVVNKLSLPGRKLGGDGEYLLEHPNGATVRVMEDENEETTCIIEAATSDQIVEVRAGMDAKLKDDEI